MTEARRPDSVDKLFEDHIIDDLRERDPSYYKWLVKEDRLTTYLHDCKKSLIAMVFGQWKKERK